MENINEQNNERTIKNLQKGLNTSWDIFIYGDKESGTKPGNVKVYGTIAGQREVLAERQELQKQFKEEQDQMQ